MKQSTDDNWISIDIIIDNATYATIVNDVNVATNDDVLACYEEQ